MSDFTKSLGDFKPEIVKPLVLDLEYSEGSTPIHVKIVFSRSHYNQDSIRGVRKAIENFEPDLVIVEHPTDRVRSGVVSEYVENGKLEFSPDKFLSDMSAGIHYAFEHRIRFASADIDESVHMMSAHGVGYDRLELLLRKNKYDLSDLVFVLGSILFYKMTSNVLLAATPLALKVVFEVIDKKKNLRTLKLNEILGGGGKNSFERFVVEFRDYVLAINLYYSILNYAQNSSAKKVAITLGAGHKAVGNLLGDMLKGVLKPEDLQDKLFEGSMVAFDTLLSMIVWMETKNSNAFYKSESLTKAEIESVKLKVSAVIPIVIDSIINSIAGVNIKSASDFYKKNEDGSEKLDVPKELISEKDRLVYIIPNTNTDERYSQVTTMQGALRKRIIAGTPDFLKKLDETLNNLQK